MKLYYHNISNRSVVSVQIYYAVCCITLLLSHSFLDSQFGRPVIIK